jgi:hypothetical protein
MRPKKKVYLESTIPSYLAARSSRDIIVAGHRQLTEEWWTTRRINFELYISQFVLDEVSIGDREAARRRLAFLKGIPVLMIDELVQELAADLVSFRAIPEKAAPDAAHIAIAAVHSMDYLLTWNCSHIANAEIIPSIINVCVSHGFQCPIICTPEELMGVK